MATQGQQGANLERRNRLFVPFMNVKAEFTDFASPGRHHDIGAPELLSVTHTIVQRMPSMGCARGSRLPPRSLQPLLPIAEEPYDTSQGMGCPSLLIRWSSCFTIYIHGRTLQGASDWTVYVNCLSVWYHFKLTDRSKAWYVEGIYSILRSFINPFQDECGSTLPVHVIDFLFGKAY